MARTGCCRRHSSGPRSVSTSPARSRRVDLKAELEIRHLHEKLDHLLQHQWERLMEIVQIQTELMNELVPGRRGRA